jgi:hypothetical protein
MLKYILIFLTILIVIYIFTYYNYPKKSQIYQTQIEKFKWDILLNKQPVIIDSKTINLEEFTKKWFYLNIINNFELSNSDIWNDNKYKYLIIQANNNGEILLYPASKKMVNENGNKIPDTEESLVALQISEGQIIILPFHWKFLTTINIKCVGVNDIISYFLV